MWVLAIGFALGLAGVLLTHVPLTAKAAEKVKAGKSSKTASDPAQDLQSIKSKVDKSAKGTRKGLKKLP